MTTDLAVRPNQRWSMDVMSDKLADGRSFRILTVMDQFTRECVALEADRSMTGTKVAEVLEGDKRERGCLPETITVDNGSEFPGRALESWAMGNRVQLCFIRPGRPGDGDCNARGISPICSARLRVMKTTPRSNTRRVADR
jgi:putative transposase